MKTILLILMLTVTASLYGQNWSQSGNYKEERFDTIPAILLVTDTTVGGHSTSFSMRGYVVLRVLKYSNTVYDYEYTYSYLTQAKNPLFKEYLVWGALYNPKPKPIAF